MRKGEGGYEGRCEDWSFQGCLVAVGGVMICTGQTESSLEDARCHSVGRCNLL